VPKRKNDDDDYDDEPRGKGAKTGAQRIPQHKHCMICHKAIPAKDKMCSEECEAEYARIDRKRRNYMMIMYALFFFVIVIFMVSLI
jgi:predicted nucleic acid-binding Zn ribbon protein